MQSEIHIYVSIILYISVYIYINYIQLNQLWSKWSQSGRINNRVNRGSNVEKRQIIGLLLRVDPFRDHLRNKTSTRTDKNECLVLRVALQGLMVPKPSMLHCSRPRVGDSRACQTVRSPLTFSKTHRLVVQLAERLARKPAHVKSTKAGGCKALLGMSWKRPSFWEGIGKRSFFCSRSNFEAYGWVGESHHITQWIYIISSC